MADNRLSPDELYIQAISLYDTALSRLAIGYEANAERRRDLLQDIHIALWKSLRTFNGDCSLRTWVYRVGHNVAINHVIRERRELAPLADIEELEELAHPADAIKELDDAQALTLLHKLVHSLNPMDRQIVLLYLDDVDANSIGEIVGIAPGNVATKIHRIKRVLARAFNEPKFTGGNCHE